MTRDNLPIAEPRNPQSRQTFLSHTFHTHSFSETKAGQLRFAFTPRSAQNTHGPLVHPLKPEDMFFVLHTNSHSHTNVSTPPRHSLAHGHTQINTYWCTPGLFIVPDKCQKCCRRVQTCTPLHSITDILFLIGDNNLVFQKLFVMFIAM